MTRVAVVGAGAIGGFLAAALTKAGVPTVVVARGEHAAAIASGGLHVESDLGTFSVAADLRDASHIGDADYLLLAFKAHQWPEILPALAPYAGSATVVVTMQNGVPFWYEREPPLSSVDPGGEIGRLFADAQVVGCVVHVSGTVVAPGRVRQSGGLRYAFGNPGGGCDGRAAELVQLLQRASLAAEADPDIRRTVWLKLVNNVGLNAVSVLRKATIAAMLSDPQARAHVRRLMDEALRVGQAMGVVGEVDVDARIAYAARLDDVKTSMLQDFERGRALEADPILGAVCELGARYGVATPEVRAAYAALQRAEASG
ncbi:MAG TPA: 2-dehydropantoate 2-reductase [Candidatus Binatia bacterium]|nr:2-dehydropantoate 2-reductase [Candidatus Binatia bacterium]